MNINRELAEQLPRDKMRLDFFRSIATGQMVHRGYHMFLIRGHHRAGANGYVKTSILMAEAAMGKPLPPKAVVHHVNGDPMDNRSSNLVVCEDNKYHHYLHVRKRALNASGKCNTRPCSYCHNHDEIQNMTKMHTKNSYYHRDCMIDYCRKYKTGERRMTANG
jgi:hypothetical protein